MGSVLITGRDDLTTVSMMLRVVYSIQIRKAIAVNIIGEWSFAYGFHGLIFLSLKNTETWAGEVAQWLRTHMFLLKVQAQFLTHVEQLKTTQDSSSK